MKSMSFRDWTPADNFPRKVFVESVTDNRDGLHVVLGTHRHAKKMHLTFESYIAYRNMNETNRLRTWSQVDMRNHSSFMTINNSTWIDWLVNESEGLLELINLVHYAIYTDDDCIDVVAPSSPVAGWS